MKKVEKTKEEKYYFSQKQLPIFNRNLRFEQIILTNNYSNEFNNYLKYLHLASPNKNEYKIILYVYSLYTKKIIIFYLFLFVIYISMI